MTGIAQYAKDSELPELKEAGSNALPPLQDKAGRRPGRRSANGGWAIVGWLAAAVAGCLAIAWFIFLGPGQTGSKAEWFFGAAVLCLVMVSLWQVATIQRLARRHAAEVEERHRTELAAAEERAMRELAMTQRLHRTQMDAQQRMHEAEMEAQRELARVERTQLLAQQQKLAMNGVARAVSAQTHALATLWNEGASILHLEDAEAREQAMNPVFEHIGRVVNDFSVELANANLLIEDDRLHGALHSVNEAVLMAMQVAEDVHLAVVDGRAPEPAPVASAQRVLYEKAAQARHLAWELLRTGLDGVS